MATAKMKVQPYLYVKANGEFYFASAVEGMNTLTDSVDKNGNFTLVMPTQELTIQFPDDLRPACVELLRAHREKIRAEHGNLMTRMQFQENSLLGLEAPEVLDAAEPSRGRSVNIDGAVTDADFPDDDIPF